MRKRVEVVEYVAGSGRLEGQKRVFALGGNAATGLRVPRRKPRNREAGFTTASRQRPEKCVRLAER